MKRYAFWMIIVKNLVGKISDLQKFIDQYECVVVGINNNRFRGELIEELEPHSYQVPVLIHPTAYISRMAKIEKKL